MAAQSKIELVLEIKNKIRAGLSEARREVSRRVGEMKTKIAELRTSFKDAFKNAADEIPGLNSAMRLMKNPIALGAAAVVGLGKGFMYATDKAAEFESTFHDLANLNLDKSRDQMDALRRTVLETSYKKGFKATETAEAFNDVQSTTGKYGDEVRQIVEKQGEFAKLMRADFKQYIEGSAKSMINFGFNADRLDEFNRSAYATMNVGVVSFNELARVQSVYAGAARSAMQDFDAANKMFSLFTISTKSADVAATYTKSLFGDLTKPSTIKAFKQVGINVFETNGQFKQADKLLLELNKKFSKAGSDKEIIKLKNQFAGSEGLIAMIQQATDKTGQLQQTLSDFDNTIFDSEYAREMAKRDVNYQTEVVENKIEARLIELGNILLPIKLKVLEIASKFLGADKRPEPTKTEKDYDFGANVIEQNYPELKNIQNLTNEQLLSLKSRLKNEVDKTEDLKVRFNKELKEKGYDGSSFKDNAMAWLTKLYRGDEGLNDMIRGDYGATNKTLKGKIDRAKSGYNDAVKMIAEIQANKKTNDDSGNTSTLADSVTSVTGSAKQIRNIAVNIDSFNKGGINTQNTTLQKMDANQIEDWFIDACMKAVRNIELSYT